MQAAGYAASGVSALLGLLRNGTTPVVDKESDCKKYERILDPFSLIVSLAVAAIEPINSKPTLFFHHIEWERPNPLHMGNLATLERQGLTRSMQNLWGTAIAGHQVIEYWEEPIKKALFWYQPHLEKNEVVRRIFERARLGLERVLKTYKDETDKTPLHLQNCIRRLKEGLEEGRYESVPESPLKAIWNAIFFQSIDLDLTEAAKLQGDIEVSVDARCDEQIAAIMARIRERCTAAHAIIKVEVGKI